MIERVERSRSTLAQAAVLAMMLAAALALAGLTYGVARAAEPILPGLSAEAVEHNRHQQTPAPDHEPAPPTAEVRQD